MPKSLGGIRLDSNWTTVQILSGRRKILQREFFVPTMLRRQRQPEQHIPISHQIPDRRCKSSACLPTNQNTLTKAEIF